MGAIGRVGFGVRICEGAGRVPSKPYSRTMALTDDGGDEGVVDVRSLRRSVLGPAWRWLPLSSSFIIFQYPWRRALPEGSADRGDSSVVPRDRKEEENWVLVLGGTSAGSRDWLLPFTFPRLSCPFFFVPSACVHSCSST